MQVSGVAGVEYKKKIYFTSFSPIGGLYCFDLNTEKTEFVKAIEVENREGLSHIMASIYGSMAWFIPCDSRRIFCIDLETMEENYYDIPSHDYDSIHSYISYLEWGEELLIVPSGDSLETAALVNRRTKEIIFFTESLWGNKCVGGYVFDDKAYFVTDRGNICTKYDFKTRTISRTNGSYIGKEVNWILSHGENVWMMNNCLNDIVIFNCNSKERHSLNLAEDGVYIKNTDGIVLGDNIVLFPFIEESRMIRILNINGTAKYETETLEKITDDVMIIHKISSNEEMNWYMSSGGYIYLFDEKGYIIEKKKYSVEVDEKEVRQQINRRLCMSNMMSSNEGVFYENNLLHLDDFLWALIEDK